MNKGYLTGKKILFFSPAFFGYEHKIANKMRELGADVDYYDVRSVKGAFSRAILKIFPSMFIKQSIKYYERVLAQHHSEDYDYVLIVKGDMTPIPILKKMRQQYSNAEFVLYLWDSIDNIPGIKHKFQYFDRLLTFDLVDAKHFSAFQLRPLFFADEYAIQEKVEQATYDLAFLGTIHSDRYRILKKIDQFAQTNQLSKFYFCYLQSKFIYFFYKITNPEYYKAEKEFFTFEKMDSQSISQIVSATNVIIDIEHPKQTGLTMRTIEMIGMQKKLITTNASIKEYDFYNSENIFVIDRSVSELDIDFFNRPYRPLEETIYHKYSLEQWVLDVLGVDDEQ
ncbi:TPA: capsular biosynthesis protein CpsH [Streptococcus suis]|nr:capsular biosynthesis protein CpsH [Streptococcus suis]